VTKPLCGQVFCVATQKKITVLISLALFAVREGCNMRIVIHVDADNYFAAVEEKFGSVV